MNTQPIKPKPSITTGSRLTPWMKPEFIIEILLKKGLSWDDGRNSREVGSLSQSPGNMALPDPGVMHETKGGK